MRARVSERERERALALANHLGVSLTLCVRLGLLLLWQLWKKDPGRCMRAIAWMLKQVATSCAGCEEEDPGALLNLSGLGKFCESCFPRFHHEGTFCQGCFALFATRDELAAHHCPEAPAPSSPPEDLTTQDGDELEGETLPAPPIAVVPPKEAPSSASPVPAAAPPDTKAPDKKAHAEALWEELAPRLLARVGERDVRLWLSLLCPKEATERALVLVAKDPSEVSYLRAHYQEVIKEALSLAGHKEMEVFLETREELSPSSTVSTTKKAEEKPSEPKEAPAPLPHEERARLLARLSLALTNPHAKEHTPLAHEVMSALETLPLAGKYALCARLERVALAAHTSLSLELQRKITREFLTEWWAQHPAKKVESDKAPEKKTEPLSPRGLLYAQLKRAVGGQPSHPLIVNALRLPKEAQGELLSRLLDEQKALGGELPFAVQEEVFRILQRDRHRKSLKARPLKKPGTLRRPRRARSVVKSAARQTPGKNGEG